MDDILLWLLLASFKENADCFEWAGLLFYYQSCMTATQLQERLCFLFQKVQDDIPGLNFVLRKQTADSLVNLARQWFSSPYLSTDIVEEVVARRSFREFCLKQQPEKVDALELAWRPHTTLGLREAEHGHSECTNAAAVAEAALQVLSKNRVADIATQLTVIDAELFERVPTSEYVAKRFQKAALSPTLSLLKVHVNTVTHWCSHVILFSKTDGDRLQCFKRLIAVAEHLVSMRNYGGAGAIVGGLTTTSVSRLKRLHESLPTKYAAKLEKLSQTFSPMENYRQYRALPDQPPFLPYLPACLKDLTYVTDGMSVHYKGQEEALAVKTLVSFADVLHKMGKDRLVTSYGFRPDDTLFPFFCQISHLSEDELYNRSCELQKGRMLKKAASVAHIGPNAASTLPTASTSLPFVGGSHAEEHPAVPASPQVPPTVVHFKLPTAAGKEEALPAHEGSALSPTSKQRSPPPVRVGAVASPIVLSPPPPVRQMREPPALPPNPNDPSSPAADAMSHRVASAPQRPPPPPPMEAELASDEERRIGQVNGEPTREELPKDEAVRESEGDTEGEKTKEQTREEAGTEVVAKGERLLQAADDPTLEERKARTPQEVIAAALAPRKKRKESDGHNPLAALEVDEFALLKANHEKLLADVTGAVALLESAAQLGTNRGEECLRLLKAALKAGGDDW